MDNTFVIGWIIIWVIYFLFGIFGPLFTDISEDNPHFNVWTVIMLIAAILLFTIMIGYCLLYVLL